MRSGAFTRTSAIDPPIVRRGSIVGAIIHRGKEIFLARRAATKTNWPNRLEYIGGHLDVGETLEDGLRREVREEIGTEIIIGPIINAYTHESKEAAHPFKVKIVYLCEFAKGQNPTLNPEDHSEFVWLSKDNIAAFGEQEEETTTLKKAFEILAKE